MFDAVKAELLRSVSGVAMLGVASFVLLLPALMVSVGPPLDGLRDLDDGAATKTVFGLIASAGIAAMYLGSYSVTREYHYRSMPRSLAIASLRRVLLAKTVASALAAAGLSVIGLVVWAIVTSMLLQAYGRELVLGDAFWRIATSTLFVAVCGAAIGVGVGWLVKNYYVASGIVLLIPTMIEAPLLLNAPAVERYLPVGAIAGTAALPVEGLLPGWGSAAVLLGWALAVTVLAAVIVRRREH